MERYEDKALCNLVNESKEMLDSLHEKRDDAHEISEYWRNYGETVGYVDDSDKTIQEMWEGHYEDLEEMSEYWSSFINRFENLTKNIAKINEQYKDILAISFIIAYPNEDSIVIKQYNCLAFRRECKRIYKFLLNSNYKIGVNYDDCMTFNIRCSDETDASELSHKIEMFINDEENYKEENNNGK